MMLRIGVTISCIVSIAMGGIQKLNAEDTETAYYSGLKGNEFMKNWLVLGPIPTSQISLNPEEAFAYDFLKQHGGESNILPKPGLTHQIGDKEYQLRLVLA